MLLTKPSPLSSQLLDCLLDLHLVAFTHSVTAMPVTWLVCKLLLIDKGLLDVETSLHQHWVLLNVHLPDDLYAVHQ